MVDWILPKDFFSNRTAYASGSTEVPVQRLISDRPVQSL